MSTNSLTLSHWPPSSKTALPHENFDGIRKRVRKACDRCRMKKTTCDGSRPCLRCRTDNVICCSKEGQKVRHRNFPKGYAEMLEKQHSQLACGLQEMYQRLRKASLWEGEPLDESSECPLTHDILAALNFLEPNEDGTNEEFVEQPLSSPILDESEDSIEKTSTNSSQATPKGTLHDIAMFVNPEHDSQNDFQISKSDLVINYSWPLSGPWAVEFAAA